MVGGTGTKGSDRSLPALRVGVIGAGRVGAVLAARLRAAGHEVVAAAGASDATLGRIAALLPGAAGPEVQAMAAFALCEITRGHPDNQSLIADLGGVAPFFSFQH